MKRTSIACVLISLLFVVICFCSCGNQISRYDLISEALEALKETDMETFCPITYELFFREKPTESMKSIPDGYSEELYCMLLYLFQFVLNDKEERLELAYPYIHEAILKYDEDFSKSSVALGSLFKNAEAHLSPTKLERLAVQIDKHREYRPETDEAAYGVLLDDIEKYKLTQNLLMLQMSCYGYAGNEKAQQNAADISEEISSTYIEMAKAFSAS